MRNRTAFRGLLALAACIVFLGIVASAYAADPASFTPQEIRKITFDSANATDTFSPILGFSPLNQPLYSAFWGRTNAYNHVGAGSSLWVAGRTYPDVAATQTVSYADNTRGYADLALTELANYYSSKLSLWYLMPSIGAADDYALRLVFSPSALGDENYGTVSGAFADPENPIPLTATWSQLNYDLTGGPLHSSRAAVWFRAQFHDSVEGPEQLPKNGQGPAIDDVLVSGFMFGPVRNVGATAVASNQVTLNWSLPATSKTNTANDGRNPSYRVWRTIKGHNTWEERTATRLASSPFTDTGVADGTTYQYAIQAWEPGSGTGYGEVAPYQDVVGAGLPLYGDISGTVTVNGNPEAGVQVALSGGPTNLAPMTTGADGKYAFLELAPGAYTATFTKAGYTTQTIPGLNVTAGGLATRNVTMSLAPTQTYLPVNRFRNLKSGFYLWSADPAETANIIATLSKTWKYEGVAYQINTANPLNQSWLWRFVNIKGGYYLYTADPNEKASIIANLSKTWKFEGPAYKVSTDPSGAPVWRFRNIAKGAQNGTYLYSADPAEKNTIVATLGKVWLLEGPAYYLAP